MNIRNLIALTLLSLFLFVVPSANAVSGGTLISETAEFIFSKFGRGVAGQTVKEITETTTKAATRYGNDVLPFLRSSGHAGFRALKEAGEKAPEVIKLYSRKGDESIWIVTNPKKLDIFVKHGDSAADALLKHPNIADSLVRSYGKNAAGALNSISRRSAQRLSIVANGGLLTAYARSSELLDVIRKYGEAAMDFIWKHKGALTVTAVLGSFLANPEAYITGAKNLIADSLVDCIAKNINWTLILAGILTIAFLPFIAKSFVKALKAIKIKGKT